MVVVAKCTVQRGHDPSDARPYQRHWRGATLPVPKDLAELPVSWLFSDEEEPSGFFVSICAAVFE